MRQRPTPSTAPPWPGVLAFGLAIVGGALAICAATGWSWAVDAGPVQVSLRNPKNPALAGVLCLAGSYWWLGGDGLRALSQRVEARLTRHSAPMAALLALAVLATAWHWGAFVAGGTDSSGYLNEARLWQAGTLRTVPPSPEGVAFQNGLRTITPVGFRPAAGSGEVAPVYPPGYPLLMAAARFAGDKAQFLVVPLAAGLATWTVFVVGRLIGGPIAGLLGAAATASSPTFLYQAFQPMSDVPATCAWLLAVAAVLRRTAGGDLGAAAAMIVAGLIRPNLFAMTPPLVVAAIWWSPTWRRGVGRAMAIGTPVALAALGFAWWQRWLYGGATETGYGDVSTLFGVANVWPNLGNYPRWIVDSHGYTVLLGVFAPLVVARGWIPSRLAPAHAAGVALWLIAMCGALFAFYVLYLPFDNWTYTRFLLPMLPLALTLAATTMVSLVSRMPQPWRTPVALLALVLVPCLGWARSRDAHAFDLWDNEQRYTEVAAFVREQPPTAVFLCMQHSGSLAYYTGRPIVRWDWLEPRELEPVLDQLAGAGHTVYAVLDDWEVAEVRARFPDSAMVKALESPVFRSGERAAIQALAFVARPGGPISGR